MSPRRPLLRDGGGLLTGPLPGRFGPDAVAGLPPPVQRYLQRAIAPGTPLWSSAQLRMRGRIRLTRWSRFHARQVLAPHRGFVWAARTGLVSGSDRYVDGAGRMSWRVLGMIPVVEASGPDIDRSAIGRGMAEAVWLPTTLLPAFGVQWCAQADDHITASFAVDDVPIALELDLDRHDLPVRFTFDRWGDPDDSGTYGWHRFGGVTTAFGTFGGCTIPAVGVVGWHPGTPRWPDSAFFRFHLHDVLPTTATDLGAMTPDHQEVQR